MISYPLLKRNMVSCFKLFLMIFAVLCIYAGVIIYMYNPELSDMLNEYQNVLPGMMAAVGMTGIASNLIEWIQIYLYGFIMTLFPLIFIIALVQKTLVSYIDSGSMANLLTTGNSRGKIIRTQAVSVILWMFLLLAAITATGIICSEMMFPGELDMRLYVTLNASTLLLQLALTGIAFLAACCCREAKYYYAFGAGIPILFSVIAMISNTGDKLENLKYFTIFTLLPSAEIVSGEGDFWRQNLALGVITILLFGAGIKYFEKRDLFI